MTLEERTTTIKDMIGTKIPVLDDGFVIVLDAMGDDYAVVEAARKSFDKDAKPYKHARGLIRFMMRGKHSTPFEQCVLKLAVRVPMDCWRQWIRHRTAHTNELSTRYTNAIDSNQKTKSNEWRSQSKDRKQGSGDFLDVREGAYLSARERLLHEMAADIYSERLKYNVANEQARKDLPLSTYTEAIWSIDLHNLLHFLELRMHEHAQYEIRQYANVIGEQIVAYWCPIVWEAFRDYRLNGIMLSADEQVWLQRIAFVMYDDQMKQASFEATWDMFLGMLSLKNENREVQAFKTKVMKIFRVEDEQ